MPSRPSQKRLGDREITVLVSLWRWGVLSTSALCSRRYFPTACPQRAYNRLLDLRDLRLIEMVGDGKCQNCGWVLTVNGFRAIREYLPALREEGYCIEHFTHDFLTTTFHLGDWLLRRPENVSLFSEQELRRVALEDFPAWVPTSVWHRPDGYFGFKKDNVYKVVAIEVELNRKPSARYISLAEAYAEDTRIERVLWLVREQSLALRIQKVMADAHSRSLHHFIFLNDFLALGWCAKIANGQDRGKSVRDLLCEIAGEKPVESGEPSTTLLLLDSRRSPKKSKKLPLSSSGDGSATDLGLTQVSQSIG